MKIVTLEYCDKLKHLCNQYKKDLKEIEENEKVILEMIKNQKEFLLSYYVNEIDELNKTLKESEDK